MHVRIEPERNERTHCRNKRVRKQDGSDYSQRETAAREEELNHMPPLWMGSEAPDAIDEPKTPNPVGNTTEVNA